jgi:poly(3-hydroxybutyrate) depolymerase
VFLQQSSANKTRLCFTWFDPAKDRRGAGEAASVKSMVDYEKAHLSIDPARVLC